MKQIEDIVITEHSATYDMIERASPGSEIIYHTGFLAYNCHLGEPRKRFTATGRRSGAWAAYQDGLCVLAQRRNVSGGFDYLAHVSKR